MRIRNLTPEELQNSLLPPTFIQEMKEMYALTDKDLHLFTESAAIALIAQEINQHKNSMIDFLETIHTKLPEDTKEKFTKIVQAQLPHHLLTFITRRAQQFQHNIAEFFAKNNLPETENQALEVIPTNLAQVLKKNKNVVLYVWADWYAPCKIMHPILNQLLEQYKEKVLIGKANIDAHEVLAKTHNIENVPTLLFFHQGTLQQQLTGIHSLAKVQECLTRLLADT